MSYVDELLATAEKLLVGSGASQPSRSDCNRAVSSAYYACFHHICALVADRVSGLANGTELGNKEWTEVFRSITHTGIIQALVRLKEDRPDGNAINEITLRTYNKLYSARQDADYNAMRTFEVGESKQLIYDATLLVSSAFTTDFQQGAAEDLTYFIRCLFSIKSKAVSK